MHELGNVQYAAQGMRALKPARNELPDPTRKAATIKIPEDDAAVAVIRNPWQIQDNRQYSQYPDALLLKGRLKETESRTKTITAASEGSRFHVYADPSKLRVWLANEIEAINSFEGFLLGVHDKIETFPKNSEFSLKQVRNVENRVSELYETLELYKFTLKQIRAEALKALHCQGNLGPRRALELLKETIAKQDVAGLSAEEQAATDEELNK